ncbi:lipid asymmetry maintenance protein MlaB [Dongia soli]|uniref:STAS domain-containing protein n=1 Tax=Dongia soli TaxID=600628 RepID=UPI00361B0F12
MEDRAQQQSAICIRFPNAVTIRNIEVVHTEILGALSAAGRIEIDCSDLGEADLSLVQLLIALRKSAARRNTPLALIPPSSGLPRDILKRADLLPSAQDSRSSSFAVSSNCSS